MFLDISRDLLFIKRTINLNNKVISAKKNVIGLLNGQLVLFSGKNSMSLFKMESTIMGILPTENEIFFANGSKLYRYLLETNEKKFIVEICDIHIVKMVEKTFHSVQIVDLVHFGSINC